MAVASITPKNGSIQHWIVVRDNPTGQFTAQPLGLPDFSATAPTREEAIQKVHDILTRLLATGNLVLVELKQESPILQAFGRSDPNDSDEVAYLEELTRMRREDLERTLKELDQECSNSSSTPTT